MVAARRLAFFLAPLALYGLTAAPGPGWIDAPMIASNTHAMQLGVWVNTHNAFHVLGRLWLNLLPLPPHYALNLLCALLGAITVQLVFATGVRLTGNVKASAFGAVSLMFSHSLWWHSTMLEVYTLNTALLAAMLYAASRFAEDGRWRWVALAAACWGLGCSNHALMGLLGLGIAAALVGPSERRSALRRALPIALLAFLAGFSLYLYVFIEEMRRQLSVPHTSVLQALGAIADSTTGGHFRSKMFPDTLDDIRWAWRGNYLLLIVLNYPSAALPAIVLGARALWRSTPRVFAWAFIGWLGAQVTWSANYLIWDMYAFSLPVYVLLGLLAILGADAAMKRFAGRRLLGLVASASLLCAPALYHAIPSWAREDGLWRRYFSTFDFVRNLWDPVDYFANPNKLGYDHAARVAAAAWDVLPPEAVMLDDDGKGHYLLGLYEQGVLGHRRDVEFIPLFGPKMQDTDLTAIAERLRVALDDGRPVYTSSLYWPERPVLDHLHARISGREVATVSRMSTVDLVADFPRWSIVPIELPGTRATIYRFERRDESVLVGDEIQVEGMHLQGRTTGRVARQWLGGKADGSYQFVWTRPAEGESLTLTFEVQARVDAEAIIGYGDGRYFGRCAVGLGEAETIVDGFAHRAGPTREASLGPVHLLPGEHALVVRPHAGEGPRGCALDYLRFRPLSGD